MAEMKIYLILNIIIPLNKFARCLRKNAQYMHAKYNKNTKNKSGLKPENKTKNYKTKTAAKRRKKLV